MDDIEERLTAAMTARTELVTEESLRESALPPREPRRWPALAAAAAAVLVIAGIVVAVNWPRPDLPADPPPPRPPSVLSSDVPPTTTEAPPVAVAPPATGSSSVAGTSSTVVTSDPPPPPPCGAVQCTLVSSADVAGDRVELWAGTDSADWQLRVDGVVVPGPASSFADKVACSVVAGRPVCLVHTWYLGDSDNQLGLERRDGWRFTGAQFPTPYGAERIEPRDLYANGSIEVVSAETVNDTGLWTAQVWRWDGSRLGCTPHVDAKEKLPGWPTITPDVQTLATANCWGG